MSLKYRILALSMALMGRLGAARITSLVEIDTEAGEAGVVTNAVRIRKLGILIYLLDEQYHLAADGRGVTVRAHERFGPIPFLFNNRKEHPARIGADGMSAVYDIPLLGDDWIGTYTVHDDRNQIDAEIRCSWASSQEVIARVA